MWLTHAPMLSHNHVIIPKFLSAQECTLTQIRYFLKNRKALHPETLQTGPVVPVLQTRSKLEDNPKHQLLNAHPSQCQLKPRMGWAIPPIPEPSGQFWRSPGMSGRLQRAGTAGAEHPQAQQFPCATWVKLHSHMQPSPLMSLHLLWKGSCVKNSQGRFPGRSQPAVSHLEVKELNWECAGKAPPGEDQASCAACT